MKTRNQAPKMISLGLTILGPGSYEKTQKIRTLALRYIGTQIGMVGTADGYYLEISDIYSKAVRERALNFARGVLATLES